MDDIAIAGIQPTGSLHIGNYLGMIATAASNPPGSSLLLFVADLHALTTSQAGDDVRESSMIAAATCIACGLDMSRVSIFIQSDVPCHAEMCWFLSCIANFGHLSRMTQFKDKSQKNLNINLGLFAYPVLMAADILLYKSKFVVIGDDQKQHIEFTRDLAATFNARYNTNILVMPEPIIPKGSARIMSLQDGTKKMSKSDAVELSRINLDDADDIIIKKIQRAKTDSIPHFAGDLSARPEIRNLVKIFCTFSGRSEEAVTTEYDNTGFAKFKCDLGDLLVAKISPIRNKAAHLLADRAELTNLLELGRVKARNMAEENIYKIRHIIKI